VADDDLRLPSIELEIEMATIIDELVVQLSLDPSEFSDGERRLADSLKRLESTASRGGQRVQESVGQGAVQFFRTLEAPFSQLRKHFENLATYTDAPRQQLRTLEDQGRRTGESVEGGALAGARGLRVLGAAGLGVFAAYEALSKTISSANEGASRLFSQNIGAAAANLPIAEYSALAIAFQRGPGAVPQEQTQGTLSAWHQAGIAVGHGDTSGADQLQLAASRYLLPGLNFYDPNATEQNLLNLAADLHNMPRDQAISAGEALGLTREQASGYAATGRPSEADLAAARQQAATGNQAKAAGDLVEATNRLSVAWDKLDRQMNELVDGPIAKLEDALTAILNFFSGDKSPTDAGLDIWGAFGVGPHAKPSADAPPDTRNFWQRNAPTWLGGKPVPTAPATTGGGTGSTSWVPPSGTDMNVIASTVAGMGGNLQTQAAFLSMFGFEDPNLNPSGTEEIAGSGGVGGRGGASWAQWTASRRRTLEGFGWTGTNPATDRIASAKMLHYELTQDPSFAGLIQKMNAAPSATEAAKIGSFVYEQGGSPARIFKPINQLYQ
jgi:hypothetical protein